MIVHFCYQVASLLGQTAARVSFIYEFQCLEIGYMSI